MPLVIFAPLFNIDWFIFIPYMIAGSLFVLIGLFKKSNRSFNVPLFMSISEIIAHKREYDKLITGKHDNEFVILYQSKIKDLVKPYFQLIQALTNNSKILKKVEKERWF